MKKSIMISDSQGSMSIEEEKHKIPREKITPNTVVTLTFGDAGENHIGNQMIGEKGQEGSGFNINDFIEIRDRLAKYGIEAEIIDLKEQLKDTDVDISKVEDAYILIVRQFLPAKNAHRLLYDQLAMYKWDRKYYDTRRKKVLNKHARANVCFNDEHQEAVYEEGKGTILSWDEVPELKRVRAKISMIIGAKGKDLICEGNWYDNKNKNGIGWHGDAERTKVVAIRLGATMPITFNWFYKHTPVGKQYTVNINNGDLYIMSEKASGADWKRSSIYTLRHAAGGSKYISLDDIWKRIKKRDKK